MLVNADCTIYEANTYIRHELRDVYWNDSRGRTVTKSGIQIADSVVVYVYDSDYVPQAGDIIVRGITDFAFDTRDERSISASMKEFRTAYPGFAVVKNVNDARYGGLPHIEILAR